MKNMPLAFMACLLLSLDAAWAQELVVTNARLIDGRGSVLERGTLVVRGGRIVSISPGDTTVEGVPRLDAQGMTVMPGLIDTHRHLGTQVAVLRRLLENGLTTVMSMGDRFPAVLQVAQAIANGQMEGPRVIAVGPMFTRPNGWPVPTCGANAECRTQSIVEVDTPAAGRAKVAELADAGAAAIKVMYLADSNAAMGLAEDTLAAVEAEARRHGLDTVAHIESVGDMLAAARLGVDRFVHVPTSGRIAGTDGARVLREAKVPVSTTVSWQSPAIQKTAGQARPPERDAMLENALANIRQLWDAGVTVAFGTDSPVPLGPAAFMVEVDSLAAVLSPQEIVAALTRNAAVYLALEDQIGALDAGKIADLVVVDGNPLADIRALSRVVVVIQNGRIVVDKRLGTRVLQPGTGIDTSQGEEVEEVEERRGSGK